MSGLIPHFAAGQTQSQLGLASQALGLTSGSNAHPFLEGVTSDCKSSHTSRARQCRFADVLGPVMQRLLWALP